jgi:hypothetical protein
MKRWCLLLLAVSFAVSLSVESDAVNFTRMFIAGEDEGLYGLQKLTAPERAKLNELFGTIATRLSSNLPNSALAYLKDQGWIELELTGIEKVTLDKAEGEIQLMAARVAGTRYLLEPETFSGLGPGTYLASLSGTGCQVIDTYGKVTEFGVRQAVPGQGN